MKNKLIMIMLITLVLAACSPMPVNIEGRADVGGTPFIYKAQVNYAPTNTEAPYAPTVTQTRQPTLTPSLTATRQPTGTPTPAPYKAKYYLADQVPNAADLPRLAGWGANTVIKSFSPSASASSINAYMQAAKNAGVMVVAWPSDTSVRPKCPFPYPAGYPDGNIDKVKPLMDKLAAWDNWIGITNAHEPYWSCIMDEREMAGLRTKLKEYATSKGRPDVKVWNYIDNIDGHDSLSDAEIPQIGDVFVTWQHCAGNAEGTCDNAIQKLRDDKARAAGVELVWLVQTFTIANSNYATKFSLTELQTVSCQAMAIRPDGFGWYTWDAWYTADLIACPDLWPGVQYVTGGCK